MHVANISHPTFFMLFKMEKSEVLHTCSDGL